MNTAAQLIYHKSFRLRAGETIKVLLGEVVPLSKATVRIDLELGIPKTLTLTPFDSHLERTSPVRHVRVDKARCDFPLAEQDIYGTFDELHISVPEDTEVHIGIYIGKSNDPAN